MNIKRLSMLNSTVVKTFFSEFKELRSQYSVEIEDIYNMNEIDFRMRQITD